MPAQFSSAARQPRATLDACMIPSSLSERRLVVSILILGGPATGMSWLSPWATPMPPPFLKHWRRGDGRHAGHDGRACDDGCRENDGAIWGFGLMAIVIATGVAVGGLLLLSSSNQLAVFQTGVSVVATVASNQAATATKR